MRLEDGFESTRYEKPFYTYMLQILIVRGLEDGNDLYHRYAFIRYI